MTITIWRKQPIYVVRRTPDMVTRLKGHDPALKDPNSDRSDQPPYARNLTRSRKDRKSTRLNSSHSQISYAVFCLKKKKIAYYDFIVIWSVVSEVKPIIRPN